MTLTSNIYFEKKNNRINLQNDLEIDYDWQLFFILVIMRNIV